VAQARRDEEAEIERQKLKQEAKKQRQEEKALAKGFKRQMARSMKPPPKRKKELDLLSESQKDFLKYVMA